MLTVMRLENEPGISGRKPRNGSKIKSQENKVGCLNQESVWPYPRSLKRGESKGKT